LFPLSCGGLVVKSKVKKTFPCELQVEINFVSPPSGLKEIFITPTPGFTRGHHSVASSRHVGNTDKFNPKNISRLNDVTYFEF
jgi:hypothetical protein